MLTTHGFQRNANSNCVESASVPVFFTVTAVPEGTHPPVLDKAGWQEQALSHCLMAGKQGDLEVGPGCETGAQGHTSAGRLYLLKVPSATFANSATRWTQST